MIINYFIPHPGLGMTISVSEIEFQNFSVSAGEKAEALINCDFIRQKNFDEIMIVANLNGGI